MEGAPRDFEDLDLYRILMQITRLVYELEDRFPQDEMPILYSRMRASAVDVGAKLAEGFGRDGLEASGAVSAETARQVRGKLGELRHYVLTAAAQFFLDESHVRRFDELYERARAAVGTDSKP